jgi:hypothetical protein
VLSWPGGPPVSDNDVPRSSSSTALQLNSSAAPQPAAAAAADHGTCRSVSCQTNCASQDRPSRQLAPTVNLLTNNQQAIRWVCSCVVALRVGDGLTIAIAYRIGDDGIQRPGAGASSCAGT